MRNTFFTYQWFRFINMYIKCTCKSLWEYEYIQLGFKVVHIKIDKNQYNQGALSLIRQVAKNHLWEVL